MYRIGEGYDIHKFVEGRKFILGGIEIEYKKGLLGHSDADVLIHAIIDSILGAAGLFDIGYHFPDNDIKYKDISSIELLKKVLSLKCGEKIFSEKYDIINIDSTIICEEPKLKNYISDMRKKISSTLSIDFDKVNVKAKTEEGLGYIGEGMAISARAVCMLRVK